MSVSNAPLTNSQASQAYTDDGTDIDFESYESFKDTELADLKDGSNSYFQWDQESSDLSGRAMPSVDGLRRQVAELEKQLRSHSKLSAVERQQFAQEIQQIKGLLNRSQGFISATTQQQLLSDATKRLSTIEAKTLGTHPKIFGELQDGFESDGESEGQFSASAQGIAARLRLDAETLAEAAQGAGLNLDQLPKAPDDSVINFLNALDIPSSDDLAEYVNLRDQRKNELSNLNSKADLETSNWRADSERIPSVQVWKDLYKYFKKEDSYSVQMQGLVKKMERTLTQALEALGYSVSSSSSLGRIQVGGNELDFLNEDTGNYKLDDIFNELMDPSYSPAPRNTEAGDYQSDEPGQFWRAVGGNTQGTGTNFTQVQPSADGYPTVSFSSG